MNKVLFVAWRSEDAGQRRWGPVGRLEHDGLLYRFVYTQGARTLPGFRPFPEMPDLEQVYESDSLFPLFANRLLSSSRPEYEAFLVWGGFDVNDPPDPISILGVTEGIRQTDAIEVFPCPGPDASGCYLNKFFLHGVRWVSEEAVERISELRRDDALRVKAEPSNPYDPDAMAVWTDEPSLRIGYVPRYLAREVRQLREECGEDIAGLWVERVNSSAPLQQRLLCRMTACWPEGFHPCSQREFEPIPSPVSHTGS